MKGPNTASVAGVYGTQGVSAPGNNPGGRHGAATWTDALGNLWLFGGEGYASTNNSLCWLNDLWKYNPTTNEWTWMRGSTGPNAPSVYGVQGVAAAGNDPGGREFPISWTDASGNFWLYGGECGSGRLGDLWKYNSVSNQWTWMKGSTGFNATGIYGTLNVSSPANNPGSRYWSGAWTDNTGRLWMFGGFGFGASASGRLNDLWRYNTTNNEWTWMGGSTNVSTQGIYGTMNIPAPGNAPGAREFPSFFTSATGKLVLWGGFGYGGGTAYGFLNDMWEYDVTTNMWTWLNGSNSANQVTTYGTLGVASTANVPGGRYSSASWTDPMGNFWLFGGHGAAATTAIGKLNDLFRYNPSTNEWTWVKGSTLIDQAGTYGTLGVQAIPNTPGGRWYNSWWRNPSGNSLWLFGGLGYAINTLTYDNMSDLWGLAFPCNPDSLKSAPVATLCSGGTVNLTAFNLLPSPTSWYTVATAGSPVGSGTLFSTPTLTAQSGTTVYTYYAQANSCTTAPRATINITVFTLPQLTVTGPSSVCPGQTGTLTITGAQSYSWNTGSVSNSISFTTTASGTNLIATGTSSNNCQSSITIPVFSYPTPNITASSARNTICKSDPVLLTAAGGSTYIWNGNSNTVSIIVSPTVTTTYTVTGTDLNGCSKTVTLTQFVSNCTGIGELQNTGALVLYPNPGNGSFKVRLPEDGSLVIFSQLGAVVLESKLKAGDNFIDAELNKGIYFYTFSFIGTGNDVTGKLIVE